MHSSKKNVQLLSQQLQNAEIQNIVISPGSRNAPIVLELSENPYFNCYSIVDERSAAFFALGMAQQLKQPTAICCTSGSALANYYPAVAEAFYQSIPLVVISADRPENYTDIFDGQTIRQNHFFEKHSRFNIELEESEDLDILNSNSLKIHQALQCCHHLQGPIHINMPLDEPLYHAVEKTTYSTDLQPIKRKTYATLDFSLIQKQWKQYDKKMLLCGMLPKDESLQNIIYQFAQDENAVILCESISNLSHYNIFSSIDSLIFNFSEEEWREFAPEIVLTVGQNIVSKKIKQLLRSVSLQAHWHIDEHWSANTFFQLSQYFEYPKTEFLKGLYSPEKTSLYFQKWSTLRENKKNLLLPKIKKTPFCDLKVYEFLSKKLPKDILLQIGNSSAIRYSQLFPFHSFTEVNCNRGTSGIEGSISTAIGASVATEKPTVLIIGDISFFYENSALWNNYLRDDFKIIVVNNKGGAIFDFIKGPQTLKYKNEFLTTVHNRNAKGIAHEYQLEYYYADSIESLNDSFENFINCSRQSILEIDTSQVANSEYLTNYLS